MACRVKGRNTWSHKTNYKTLIMHNTISQNKHAQSTKIQLLNSVSVRVFESANGEAGRKIGLVVKNSNFSFATGLHFDKVG